jgi:aryl-alcohol dehydrogenase-like predicted oxidoreductase
LRTLRATGDESEALIGRWVASRRARDRVILGSKCGARPRRPGAGLDDSEGLSSPAIRRACESSLRRLRTDRIDIYWAHWEDRSVPLEETVGGFGELVAEGKVRLLGLSNHRTWRIERRACAGRGSSRLRLCPKSP